LLIIYLVGYYCRGGVPYPCPPGFICPRMALSTPITCPFSSSATCEQEKLSAVIQCPLGAVCTTPYMPPIMTPAGQYIQMNNKMIKKCKSGDYCPFGRFMVQSTNELKCPAFTYCTTNTVLLPEICQRVNDSMTYCPPGTVIPNLCPAGNYCVIFVSYIYFIPDFNRIQQKHVAQDNIAITVLLHLSYVLQDTTVLLPMLKIYALVIIFVLQDPYLLNVVQDFLQSVQVRVSSRIIWHILD
jgi:hypothetical protein